MNKWEEAFARIDSTTSLGLKDTITTEFGTATINKQVFQEDMSVLHELVKRATPMKPFMLGRCPQCDNLCGSIVKYCPECGQYLDWSEEK